jgi:hypothetical protein
MDKNPSKVLIQNLVFIGNDREVSEKTKDFTPDTKFMTMVLPCSMPPKLALKIGNEAVNLLTSVHDADAFPSGVEIWAYLSHMLPERLPLPAQFRELRMLAGAIAGILQSEDFVTAPSIVELASVSKLNLKAQPCEWKRNGEIFAITICGQDYFPLYVLQPSDGFRPHKILKEIIELFDGVKDGWGIAFWFLSCNSYLGGRRPKDMLSADAFLVVEAARGERNEIMHG